MFKEFKKFIMRGNMLDLAVGMIIGTAFNAIVTSLVNDMFMPLIGWIVGDTDFSNLYCILGHYDGVKPETLAAAKELGLATFNYGNFITAIIHFLLMAIVVFLIVKGMNKLSEQGGKLKKKQPEKPAEPTTKICPFCQSEISIKATRCPHCTSELNEKK